MATAYVYTPVGWVSGSAPKINGPDLAHMDAGIQQGAHITGLESDRTAALATANPGALFYATDSGVLYISLGSGTWQRIAGDPNWTTPTLNGSWGTSSTAITAGESVVKYRKNGMGFVQLVGYLDTGFVANSAIFNLPTGYRPTATRRFMVATGGTTAFAIGYIHANGDVMWNGGGSTYIDLAAMQFYAEQ